jgi:hypothetical protein
MAASLADVIQNTKDIYMTDSSLDVLLDFERVLDLVQDGVQGLLAHCQRQLAG